MITLPLSTAQMPLGESRIKDCGQVLMLWDMFCCALCLINDINLLSFMIRYLTKKSVKRHIQMCGSSLLWYFLCNLLSATAWPHHCRKQAGCVTECFLTAVLFLTEHCADWKSTTWIENEKHHCGRCLWRPGLCSAGILWMYAGMKRKV